MNNLRKISFSFLLLVLFPKLQSQPPHEIFLAYCKQINQAELNLMDGKFQEAMLRYDSAFALSPSPLAKDIHNAMACAKKIKDEGKTRQYLHLMVMEKSLLLRYYREEGLLKYLSREDREKIKQKHKEKIKSGDYLFLQNLLKEDRAIRTPENYTQRYHLILMTDSLTYRKFKSRFGDTFPGEEWTLDFPCGSGMDWVLFRHWTANKGLGLEAVEEAEKLMENFKFSNYAYAIQYDNKLATQFTRLGHGLIVKTIYAGKKTRKKLNGNQREQPIQFTPESILEINQRRAEIGLETYEEYLRKIDFFTRHKEYCFPTGYSRVSVSMH